MHAWWRVPAARTNAPGASARAFSFATGRRHEAPEEDVAELVEDAAELPNKQYLESEQEDTLMMGLSGPG